MNRFIVIVCITFFTEIHIFGQERWSLEIQGSAAENISMPLHISQKGYPDINLIAKFNSRSLTAPISWDWRISHWSGGQAWEIEAIHHKLFLENTTNEVTRFNISHGFNIVCINKAFEHNYFVSRVGMGIVLAHAENIVRSLSYDDSEGFIKIGYYEFAGPVLNLSISRPINFSKRWFLNAEAKSTFAYARVKVANGNADLYNIAFHVILGLGGNFILKDK
jgi:hypothetical protein